MRLRMNSTNKISRNPTLPGCGGADGIWTTTTTTIINSVVIVVVALSLS